ncbi:hypothetical protein AURDEDRAFT_117400 [Auricularia subglabra TFB-10046 SS5]|nr:hypothetical protein AURDEDRAFT_117400 [Auricularia subglabra TFB-10046 SS5]
MDDAPASTSIPVVEREKTAPFLVRAFVKIGGFHRISLFDDGQLPTTDERQIFIWRDATLREVVHALRLTVPQTAEFRVAGARFSFKALFLDRLGGGPLTYSAKDLGSISSRDIALSDEPADPDAPPFGRERTIGSDRTLEELKFYPGDLLAVALHLPKPRESAAPALPANGAPPPKWGQAAAPLPPPARGMGGGHWRGGAPPPGGPSRDSLRDRRERDVPPHRERRPLSPPRGPPPRRPLTPPRRGAPPPGRGRGGFDRDRERGGRPPLDRERDLDRRRSPPPKSRSRSRSRSPPRRRNPRYD